MSRGRSSRPFPRRGPRIDWKAVRAAVESNDIAERLLETGAVEAVLTMKPDASDRWKPEPVLIRRAEDLAQCRGMRMGYAPLLSLLEPAEIGRAHV